MSHLSFAEMRATSRARKHPSTTIPPKPHKTNLGSTSTALQQCTMAHLLVLLRQASKVASTSASRCSDSQQLAQNSDDLDTLTTALESVAAELPLDASWETTCTLWVCCVDVCRARCGLPTISYAPGSCVGVSNHKHTTQSRATPSGHQDGAPCKV